MITHDYYKILGVEREASQAEIKNAYRKLAMKHHPDRGGDDIKFKEINEAYDCLSDPDKKQKYDFYGPRGNEYKTGHGGYEFHFNNAGSPFSDMEDLFQHFGFGLGRGRATPKNKSTNFALEITLEDVFYGKEIGLTLNMPNGENKFINVEVPSGIENGQQIRYKGMGDTSHGALRPGDLYITIRVQKHHMFNRDQDNILCDHRVNVFDMIVGGKTIIKTIDGKNLELNIPAGTQPDTIMSCRGEGLPNMRTKKRGNLYIKIKPEIPKNLSTTQLNKIKEIKNGI